MLFGCPTCCCPGTIVLCCSVGLIVLCRFDRDSPLFPDYLNLAIEYVDLQVPLYSTDPPAVFFGAPCCLLRSVLSGWLAQPTDWIADEERSCEEGPGGA